MDEQLPQTITKDLYTKAKFPGKLLILGNGTIGQGVLPLLLRHTDITPDRIQIIAAHDEGMPVAAEFGIPAKNLPLSPENYSTILDEHLTKGDFLLNLSVDVSSQDLIGYCQKKGILYLDTSIELWPGFSSDPQLTVEERTNYAIRDKVLSLRKEHQKGPTAVVTHGANPGLVSHFVKAALLDITRDVGSPVEKVPATREEWANLMQTLKVRVIHIAERDTQITSMSKQVDEFVNTWSIEGFLSEAAQPVELGWGTHEKEFPADGHEHTFGWKSAIYLNRPGALTPVRSWTPREGPYHGFLTTHDESISIAEYFTHMEGDVVAFRPTVNYAYHPCDDAVLSLREYAGNNWKPQKKKRILMDEIESGADELGVLLMGHRKRSYWFGSDLSIQKARELAPHQNATGMQVTAGVLAGVIWALENPKEGIVEPDEMNFQRILEIATPYLGLVHGRYTSWTPLRDRVDLFPEDMDTGDPWQFKNFRVM